MNRREALAALGTPALVGLGSLKAPAHGEDDDAAVSLQRNSASWPFVVPGKLNQWTLVEADGLRGPVPGFVFDGRDLAEGVPLGGLGTGYFTLEGNGQIGFCSIFNDLVPPKKIFADWLIVQNGTKNVPLSAAQVSYWGHYPVVDLTAAFPEIPVEMGMRVFAPYVVGDAAVSNTPVALFDLEVRNTSNTNLPLKLLLRFPAAPEGVKFPEYSLTVRGEGVTPHSSKKETYSIETSLEGRGARRFRFAVAWYAPSWRDSGDELRYNRYSQRFRNAEEVAEFGLRYHESLLRRVLAWQSAIYSSDLPHWLQDALIQGLYSHAKNSVWIARTRYDNWWGENGWFTHSESHTGCPIVETMVCRMHGHFPLLFFFPELEETTLDAFRHYQISTGEIPFCFGMPTSMRDPRFECQHPLNSGQYTQMVYRLYLRTGDREQLLRFYDSAKRAIRYQYSLDDDGCGLVHDQPHVRPGEAWPANQFYDCWPWHGVSSYVAGTWLATLAAGKRLAELAGDHAFATECSERLQKARASFEARLWNGSYYRLWNDVKNGKRSDVSLANQLMAEWCVRVLGLDSVLPKQHIDQALDSIARLNLKATSYGLINGVTPDGKPFDTKVHPSGDFGMNIFVGENLCSAMTFLYHGRRDVGIEVARRLYETMAVKTRSPWNQRCLLYGDSGLPLWGDDYYSNLATWVLPLAFERVSVREFTQAGLAKKMIAAANPART